MDKKPADHQCKMGDLQTYKLNTWKVTSVAGTGGSGSYYELQYEVTYSKYLATETLTLFKPTSGTEIKILGHNIDSSGFLKE